MNVATSDQRTISQFPQLSCLFGLSVSPATVDSDSHLYASHTRVKPGKCRYLSSHIRYELPNTYLKTWPSVSTGRALVKEQRPVSFRKAV